MKKPAAAGFLLFATIEENVTAHIKINRKIYPPLRFPRAVIRPFKFQATLLPRTTRALQGIAASTF